jgi:hypothetical protein
MSNVKIKSFKKPRSPRGFDFYKTLWSVFSWVFWCIERLLPLCPLLIIIWLLIAKETPHILYEYTYHDSKIYETCTYFGINGLITLPANECPLIRFISQEG